MTFVPLLAALVVAGTPHKAPTTKAATIADAWRLLPQSGSACGHDLTFDYGTDGGMRNFFCRALTIFSWKTFLSLAPVSPFTSGPHQAGKLDFADTHDFGHYNPAFVRWATTALLPAATNPQLREQTQGTYDAQVKSLARIYFQVWRVISADPAWLSKERATYGAAMAAGQADWSNPGVDLYHDILGDPGNDWGGHDPNLVRSATMWWLRRTIDETAPLWAEGLERLLSTYDAAWLKAQKAKRPPPPPKRTATPEYAQ
jgi:hypothetical protein